MSQPPAVTARDAQSRQPPARLFGWRHTAFFLGVPIIFALYMASSHRMLQAVPAGWVMAYSVTYSLLIWWLTCAVCRLFFEILRRWQPHQLVILSLGMFFAGFVSMPVTELLNNAFIGFWSEPEVRSQLTDAIQSGHPNVSFGTSLVRDGLIWILVNLFFDRFLGLPRYRYPSASADADVAKKSQQQDPDQSIAETLGHTPSVSAAPGFLKRLDQPVDLGQVLAVKAEQHYIKVYTPDRQHMILYRFSDALNELPEELGLQVHRSWWLRTSALTRLRQTGRKMVAELVTGDSIPISGPSTMTGKLPPMRIYPSGR